MTDDWQQLLALAGQLRRAGRVDEAIDAYQRLLALKPDLADSWYNLGWLQKQARRFDEALASYQRALDLDAREPEEVRLNRAVILSDHLHRPEDARRELDAALAANPGYVPALLNLGNLHEDLGDRAAARGAYEQALALDPASSLALARLAGISHSSELDVELASKLRAAIARTGADPAARADLAYALAGLLDAAGQHDEAFAAAGEANAASRAAVGPAARYDRSAHERLVDRLIAAFPRAESPKAEEAAAPLFICGMFRSGSTLLEQILGAHSRITPGGELDMIPALAASIPGYPESVPAADAATIAGWRAAYLESLPVQPTRERLVTDKRPDNFLHIGLIKAIFPGAKIVHTRRRPLDNLLSLYFLHLDPSMAYALDLEDSAHWFAEHLRLMEHWQALYPGDLIAVDYDQLVREPRPAVEPVLHSLGLKWEDSMLQFHTAGTAVKTASVWQVRQPLHTRSSGRSRCYERHVRGVRDYLLGRGVRVD